MKNEGATTTQNNNDPKPEAAVLLEKAYAGLFTITPPGPFTHYATSWWGQAFGFMIIDVENLVNSV